MKERKYHLAVDIGASSGRHMIGWLEDGKIRLEEVYRFENGPVEKNGHLCWEIDSLFQNVLEGIRACKEKGYQPETMGIDTWAVDFVLLDGQGNRTGDCVAYRDARTDPVKEELEQGGILTFAEHYSRTGIQYLKFNTIYQLCALKKEDPAQLEHAEHFLMIPEYLNYLLTGVMANEYTNASSTALVGADSHDWDWDLIGRLDLPKRIFGPICMPGTVLATFSEEVKARTGLDMKVLLPATHDTGSAFLSVPARDERSIFLSSGTWSLMGVENSMALTDEKSRLANFTNEGGYAYRYRYLKNIMGLWMIQSVRRELGKREGKRPSFPDLIRAAQESSGFQAVVDVDDARFLAPQSMIREVMLACDQTGQRVPQSTGEVMQCIYQSLALDYQRTAQLLSDLTGKTFTSLNIVGGGCQDMYLNQLTADATGLTVYAGPVEGTALGNLIVQFLTQGEFRDLQEARDAVRNSFKIEEIRPGRRFEQL